MTLSQHPSHRDCRRSARRAGWTLFEMVIVLTVMAMVAGLALPLMLRLHSAHRDLKDHFTSQRSLATLANWFREDARKAQRLHWDATRSPEEGWLPLDAMTLILTDRQVQYRQLGSAIRRLAFTVITLPSGRIVIKPLHIEAFEFRPGLGTAWSDRRLEPDDLLRMRLILPISSHLEQVQEFELVGGCPGVNDE